ncbi:shikimate dehydrogenase family protein [Chelatococcus asaccharovorans]|uniref:shikimate dehydrogenase (NADP(+)) n=1 Tax=Chelatococcus asaccharovorans TaxID=28210 RepID=A0A2V3UDZ4_9HYPH|nr:shikimate dehydrogenase [Chelatococcus asaccharovorans]MBS7707070.1 shikimate dehydrogenase [Chelatococcus asaccharovorans]PXW63250.1 shikimate dehydrogenase [Chelatococcus asaccharovorans]
MQEITGRTRILGILADPIYHVKTPQVMNALLARHGVDAVLVPFHVAPAQLATLLEGLRTMQNFGGFIATVPHKPAMLALCDETTPEARHIGAVNCVRREADGRMVGAMLDGIGFVEALRASGVEPKGLRAYLAGAGGAASAIAFALAEAGVRALTIANRTRDKAEALAGRLRHVYPTLALSTDADRVREQDLIVNATSLGMRPEDPPPLDIAQLESRQFVAEAIMDPEMTPLLKTAEARGCRIQRGLPMLESQIVLMARHMGAL